MAIKLVKIENGVYTKDGIALFPCVDTDTVDGWYEVDAPEEDRNNSDDQTM